MRLMIVDDEPLTRNSLLERIPKKELGISEVETASNGRTAYQLAGVFHPDIILCDIRMPKMDGLELAGKLREVYPDIKIIFISGYADKEYLKTAIALQAVGYVEKPINMAELKQLLEKAVGQIRDLRQHQAENEKLIHARQEVGTLVWQQLLNELFSASCTPEELHSRYGPDFFNWPDQGLYAAACLRVIWPDPFNIRAVEDSARALLELACGVLNRSRGDMEVITGLVSFSKVGIAIRAYHKAAVKPLLRELTQKTAEQYPHLTFHIGVSHFTNHLDHLTSRYQNALGMAQWADFAEKERLCFFTETPHPPLQTDAPDELREALRQRKPSSARRVIILLTRKISAMDYCDPSAVRQLYERLLVLCLNTEGGGGNPDVDQYTRMGLLGAFSKLRTLGELMRFLLSRIDSMFPELRMPDNVHPKIAQAILYIRENIASHTLSIQSIAEHLDITDNYLCSLFKKETGTTVNHAIIDARMERAKRLMMSGDKMYEVADKVGFADPNYFSAVFRKHVGVPPTQYRRDRQGKAAGEEAFHETDS